MEYCAAVVVFIATTKFQATNSKFRFYVGSISSGYMSELSLHKKWSLPLKISSVNVAEAAVVLELVIFTEAILNEVILNLFVQCLVWWQFLAMVTVRKKSELIFFGNIYRNKNSCSTCKWCSCCCYCYYFAVEYFPLFCVKRQNTKRNVDVAVGEM